MDNVLDGRIKEVAERIKTLREIDGLTMEEVAEKTSVDIEKYKQIENGAKVIFRFFIYMSFALEFWA